MINETYKAYLNGVIMIRMLTYVILLFGTELSSITMSYFLESMNLPIHRNTLTTSLNLICITLTYFFSQSLVFHCFSSCPLPCSGMHL